ncbi:MAG TPA: hypothetical protein VEF55_00520 [Candidatus Binatia bacterium]|nr:hypothetical protein [Candidatus Binatia bacterium]
MRSLFASAALAALLVACSPPAQLEAEAPSAPPPQVPACNDVAPDLARMVSIASEEAVAEAASDLRGGAIAPGVYDLTRAVRVGQATGWQGARAVALEVSEDAGGAVTFNWAGAAAGGEVDRWTATFNDSGEHPIITYTCGRMGDVAAESTAAQNALTLRVPDGANGSLHLEFARRG